MVEAGKVILFKMITGLWTPVPFARRCPSYACWAPSPRDRGEGENREFMGAPHV